MHESKDGTLTSVRMRISMDYLGNVLLPVPPCDEQDQIVHFFDWKVSSIKKLIGVKQGKISTLKELMEAEIEKQLHIYPVVDTVRLKQLGTFFKGGGFQETISWRIRGILLFFMGIFTRSMNIKHL